MQSAWAWFQSVIEWFFPASLLADPLVALIIKGCQFVVGWWFLYVLFLQPIFWFFGWLADKVKKG